MIRLRLKNNNKPEDTFLALPGSEPVTLISLPTEGLPYACQCPLCGGIFEIPNSTVFRIEDDGFEDIDSDAEVTGPEPISRGLGSDEDFSSRMTESEQGSAQETAEEV